MQLAKQRPDEAIESLRKVLEIEPRNTAALVQLGSLLGKKKEWPEAIDAMRRAVEVNPQFAVAQDGLGMMLAAGGRLEEGFPHLQEAVRLQPDNAAFRERFGIALAMKGQFAEAERQLNEAVRRNPLSAEAHNWLGAALADQGKLQAATAEFEAALSHQSSTRRCRSTPARRATGLAPRRPIASSRRELAIVSEICVPHRHVVAQTLYCPLRAKYDALDEVLRANGARRGRDL